MLERHLDKDCSNLISKLDWRLSVPELAVSKTSWQAVCQLPGQASLWMKDVIIGFSHNAAAPRLLSR
jgi:hypothetical protein